ncbi:MAG: hypothetical protein M2R45_00981 [Verrucomicrobia subdivision 3 bacterium]|nr:hypothetical protein [Limisphaerales bacterium]MCS1414648.1 hypothetical protein [Limisphaerales bacterium]
MLQNHSLTAIFCQFWHTLVIRLVIKELMRFHKAFKRIIIGLVTNFLSFSEIASDSPRITPENQGVHSQAILDFINSANAKINNIHIMSSAMANYLRSLVCPLSKIHRTCYSP